MRIKIHGGTPTSGEPLCHTCRHSTIIRGARLTEEIIECRIVDRGVPFAVTFCTNYVNRQHPSVHEMEEIAWILKSDAKRKTVGFVPSRSLRPDERFVLDED
jgi:hypothetical protein